MIFQLSHNATMTTVSGEHIGLKFIEEEGECPFLIPIPFYLSLSLSVSQETVSPKCGRLVAFSAGKENMHGVLGVTKGRRCAVALWFTLDSKHEETSFPMAENILHEIKTVS